MTESIIKPGARGPSVLELQTKLTKLGFALEADGTFGPHTRAAVEDLQALFGYDVDGVVGKGTAALIDAQLGFGFRSDAKDAVKRGLEAQSKKDAHGALMGAALARTLKRGSEGSDVRHLQRRLVALGYTLAVDGKFGEATEQTVRTLQKAFGYDEDGIVGEATHKLIDGRAGQGWTKDAEATPGA